MRRGTQKERHDFCRVFLFGGDEEDRTLDLTDANRTLSQAGQLYASQSVVEKGRKLSL